MDFWTIHELVALALLLILFGLTLSNALLWRKLGSFPPPKAYPQVNILVPARNEEKNIEQCVRSLLAQDYPAFEVVVLDDASTDGTGRILAALAREQKELRVMQGTPLPAGWLGKHWACHQLAQSSDAELILFTDADTQHHPLMLRQAVEAALAEEADLLTAMPMEEVHSWGERLVIPFLTCLSYSFLPIGLAHRFQSTALCANTGQFMLFRRAAYEQIGGFERIRDIVADDITLGRNTKAAGLRWRLVDGTHRVRCRMYRNWAQVFEGFSKSLFATFHFVLPPCALTWAAIVYGFLHPLALLVVGLSGGGISVAATALAGGIVAGCVLLWGFSYARLRFPAYLALFYPISVVMGAIIAISSVVRTVNGHATWKGRTLNSHRIRWW
jgi:chlorobactene glucosyltransferase